VGAGRAGLVRPSAGVVRRSRRRAFTDPIPAARRHGSGLGLRAWPVGEHSAPLQPAATTRCATTRAPTTRGPSARWTAGRPSSPPAHSTARGRGETLTR
jgi:hypothetical protein